MGVQTDIKCVVDGSRRFRSVRSNCATIDIFKPGKSHLNCIILYIANWLAGMWVSCARDSGACANARVEFLALPAADVFLLKANRLLIQRRFGSVERAPIEGNDRLLKQQRRLVSKDLISNEYRGIWSLVIRGASRYEPPGFSPTNGIDGPHKRPSRS
jgi:hypothetical protein